MHTSRVHMRADEYGKKNYYLIKNDKHDKSEPRGIWQKHVVSNFGDKASSTALEQDLEEAYEF